MDQTQRRSFRQRHPRHPAEVTADRLGDAVARWNDRFDPDERDMVGLIIHRLQTIAEEDRG